MRHGPHTSVGLLLLCAGAGAQLPTAPSRVPSLGPPPVLGGDVYYQIAGQDPRDMVVADFNADGILDLATSGILGPEVCVVLGDGLGGFNDDHDFNAALGFGDPGPWGLAAGDFNSDGNLDLAVTLGAGWDLYGNTNYKVNIFLGDGAAGFTFLQEIQAYGPFPIAVSTADLNEDGILDLAVISNHYGVSTHLGQGDGTFGATIPAGGSSAITAGREIACSDVDGDGHVDLIVGAGNSTSVWWGDGSAVFSTSSATSVSPGDFASLADLDGDGDLDLATAVADQFPNYTGGLWISLYSGNRSFSTGGKYGAAFDGSTVVGDMNQDGSPDIVALDGSQVHVYRNLGQAVFEETGQYPINLQPMAALGGDWDGDGDMDVACACRNYGATPWLAIRMNVTQ